MKKVRYLAITTSGEYLGLVLGDPEKSGNRNQGIVARFRRRAPSDTIARQLRRLLTRARWSVSGLGCIAVDIGPGSFTGARVGVSFARALAQAAAWRGQELPLIPVMSLEAMAVAALTGQNSASRVIVVRDAHRGEFYSAMYRLGRSGMIETARAPSLAHAEEISRLAHRQDCDIILGDGSESALGALRNVCPGFQEIQMKPEHIAYWVGRRKAVPYQNVVPYYLRRTYAEEQRRKPRVVSRHGV